MAFTKITLLCLVCSLMIITYFKSISDVNHITTVLEPEIGCNLMTKKEAEMYCALRGKSLAEEQYDLENTHSPHDVYWMGGCTDRRGFYVRPCKRAIPVCVFEKQTRPVIGHQVFGWCFENYTYNEKDKACTFPVELTNFKNQNDTALTFWSDLVCGALGGDVRMITYSKDSPVEVHCEFHEFTNNILLRHQSCTRGLAYINGFCYAFHMLPQNEKRTRLICQAVNADVVDFMDEKHVVLLYAMLQFKYNVGFRSGGGANTFNLENGKWSYGRSEKQEKPFVCWRPINSVIRM
ncbi:C-type lectin protein [Ranid herpesvirus 3]|uniref:C-type lectin protein n=1 Tax=Ranid herpesvirus 3 TaxID=1987509 RepID=A0A1X9T5G2_9VIRU|nr:C-type lectin protein [Ranid herpesvirus 3]ARR28940.1 C-type lectin protein [Ranid herpesvirus 3]